MRGPRFGTDGVRGRAGVDITSAYVRALGRAAADVLGHEFVVGRDTRESGAELEAALTAGLADGGATSLSLGVAPTPAVAYLCAADGRPGAVISASHNPWHDNGVKLFAAGGKKLDDALQVAIQSRLDAAEPRHETSTAPSPDGDAEEHLHRYRDAVTGSVNGRRYDGHRVIIDCANGASVGTAGVVLRALGADVEVLHAEPDGANINHGCGSNHPESLQARVVERGAELGFAFDGDADRVVAVDHTGRLIDGDQIIAVCAIDRQARSLLAHDTVVVTVMTNLGFRIGMARHDINVVDTNVGDRYVLEALDEGGWTLGGEQSGHVIFRDLATTGDGLLTAVQLLDVVHRRGVPLAQLADEAMRRLPQVLVNVPVGSVPTDLHFLDDAVAEIEAELGEHGRVLIRPSGTEPLVRVMVEAEGADTAQHMAERLAQLVRTGS
ncbi:MAG: phosphoglucosamine mutase [Acidimicrobiia bacterium]|nr:phosphoglucosamine mutase [Acidimicrobiia bacterium]MDH5239116.1 phosphoglucosamine mutase [Acidimicrobiia bacterium]